jgi:hypothetical protein
MSPMGGKRTLRGRIRCELPRPAAGSGRGAMAAATDSAFGRKYRTVRTAAHRSRAEDWLNPRDMSAMGGTLSRGVVAGVKRNPCPAPELPRFRRRLREAPEPLAKAEPSRFDAADPAVFSWPLPIPRAQGNRRKGLILPTPPQAIGLDVPKLLY